MSATKNTPRVDYKSQTKKFVHLIRAGNLQAGEDLIKIHTPLAISIANKYRSANTDFDNTVQDAMLGLWVAILRYDPDRGSAFSSYAYHWIRHYVLRGLRAEWKEKYHARLDDTESFGAIWESSDKKSAKANENKAIAKKIIESLEYRSVLNKKEMIILGARFGFFGIKELSFREIHKKYGIKKAEALHIERVAIKKIRRNLIKSTGIKSGQIE